MNHSSDDILETAAHFEPSAEVSTPRNLHQQWDGTRLALSKLKAEPGVQRVLRALATGDVFADLELAEVDAIVIDEGGEARLCLRNLASRGSGTTLTLDVEEVEELEELVERVEARLWRRWSWRALAVATGVASVASVASFFFRRK